MRVSTEKAMEKIQMEKEKELQELRGKIYIEVREQLSKEFTEEQNEKIK